LKIKKIVRK